MFQSEKEQAEMMQADYDLFAPTFKDNKPMLKALRKVLLGIENTQSEKELLKLIPKEVNKKVATYLLPTVTGDEELQMVNDFWFQFNLKERSQYQVEKDIEYLPIILDFFASSISRLNTGKGTIAISDIVYSKDADKETNIIKVIARNVILATVEGLITTIHHKANNKPLSAEELKLKTKQNSTK
jgi:hypothetical protein